MDSFSKDSQHALDPESPPPTQKALGVPFDPKVALVKTDSGLKTGRIPNTFHPLDDNLHTHLSLELRTDELDGILGYLWLAGLPAFKTRALHRQRVVKREVVACEQIGLHLVSFRGAILVKPIPHFLLHHTFFNNYIANVPHFEPWALGFLASYLSLIVHESDFAIAKELGLLPSAVTWEEWLEFAAQLTAALTDSNGNLMPFDNRYRFGELRLSRINFIMQFFRFRLTRGYIWLNTQYSNYFSVYFALVALLCAVYLSVALAAFQLAIGADVSWTVPRAVYTAAYWLAVSTLVALAATVVVPIFWLLILLVVQYHYIKTAQPGAYERRKSLFSTLIILHSDKFS